MRPHGRQPTRLPHPWDSPGKNTGVDIELPYHPVIPVLGIHSKETRIKRDTCTPVFSAALFTIAGTGKQPRCSLAEEWIRKLRYIYIMDYYSPIKSMCVSSDEVDETEAYLLYRVK